MDKIKNLGQVMTPQNIVNHMIDLLDLKGNELILEPSAGEGVFIKTLLGCGFPAEQIWACDVEDMGVSSLLPEGHFRCNSFFNNKDWQGKFDVVLGNPPYVRIHNIQPTVKNQIKDFKFCFGMYDLYYAFYEFGLKMLKPNGRLLFISPNTFYKNASGVKMKQYIEKNNLLRHFEDFEAEQKFDGYSTYTCIMELSNDNRTSLPNPWNTETANLELTFDTVQNGLATLADKIFIQDKFDWQEDCIHPIIKASTGEEKQIIVPPSTEAELEAYPKTYSYLLSYKDKLLNRSIKSPNDWFKFGRTQGLKNIDNEKLAIATTMPKSNVRFYRKSADWYVYSGLYMTGNIDLLEEQLQNPRLLEYLIQNGKPMRGDFVAISSTLFKNLRK